MPTLTERLRADNRDLHADVELRVGLPDTVRTREDYVRLLARLLAFHGVVERELDAPGWRHRWADLGVDLSRHRRSELLREDLAELGQPVPPPDAPLVVAGFAEALGTLYVVEGSTLGGRFLAPRIAETVPDAPLRFFRSEGRGHPRPWHALKAAVDRFGAQSEAAGSGAAGGAGEADRVVAGARHAFAVFGDRLASDRWAAVPA